MTVSLKFGIGDLPLKFFTHTFIFRQFAQLAGAKAILFLQPFPNAGDHFFIFVFSDFQMDPSVYLE